MKTLATAFLCLLAFSTLPNVVNAGGCPTMLNQCGDCSRVDCGGNEDFSNQSVACPANLFDAIFFGANLEQASFFCPQSPANLVSIDLRTANLTAADLRNADLSSADLSENFDVPTVLVNADLEQATLNFIDAPGADFQGATLTCASLDQVVSLDGADLRNTDVTCDPNGVFFRRARLRGADLRGANFTGANFSQNNGSSDFTDALISQGLDAQGIQNAPLCPLGSVRAGISPGTCATTLQGANLQTAILRDVDLSGVDLRNANLASADLSDDINLGFRTHLENALLGGATLNFIDAPGADFQGATLTCASLDQVVSLDGADLRNTDVTCDPDGVVFRRARLRGADLRGANFTGANFSQNNGNSDFTGARISQGVNENGAQIQPPTTFRRSNLQSAVFLDVDMSGVDLADSNLTSADLRGACLADADFRGATLSFTEVSGADFSAADLETATGLGNVTFTDPPPLFSTATSFPSSFDPNTEGWVETAFFCSDVIQSFEDLPIQKDNVGAVEEGSVYAITDTNGEIVATVFGALASSAAVEAEGEDPDGAGFLQFFVLGSEPGAPGTGRNTEPGLGSVVIGDLPLVDVANPPAARGDTTEVIDLTGVTIAVDVRQVSISGDTQVRLTIVDSEQNEAATASLAVTGGFQTVAFNTSEFTQPIEGSNIIRTRIRRVRVEFLGPIGGTPAHEFGVDDLALVPEPSLALIQVSAILCLAGIRRTRRVRSKSTIASTRNA